MKTSSSAPEVISKYTTFLQWKDILNDLIHRVGKLEKENMECHSPIDVNADCPIDINEVGSLLQNFYDRGDLKIVQHQIFGHNEIDFADSAIEEMIRFILKHYR